MTCPQIVRRALAAPFAALAALPFQSVRAASSVVVEQTIGGPC
jgi:hypothetical protein